MDKESLLLQLERSLKRIACHGIQGKAKMEMEDLVEHYIKKVVSHYDTNQILERFVTSKESMEEFFQYLSDHQEESVCSIPDWLDEDIARCWKPLVAG